MYTYRARWILLTNEIAFLVLIDYWSIHEEEKNAIQLYNYTYIWRKSIRAVLPQTGTYIYLKKCMCNLLKRQIVALTVRETHIRSPIAPRWKKCWRMMGI